MAADLLSHYGARDDDSHTIREAIKSTTSTVFGGLVTEFLFSSSTDVVLFRDSYVWHGMQTQSPFRIRLGYSTDIRQIRPSCASFWRWCSTLMCNGVLRRRSIKSLEWIDCLISGTGLPCRTPMQYFGKYGAGIHLVPWVYLWCCLLRTRRLI
jgi:hypothetical protein